MQNIKRIFATAIFILVSFLSVAEAEEAKEVSSTALMTVSVSRSFIEKKINSILPRVLQKIDENIICNQPLHIRCNVIGEVRRNGRVRVRFSKGALRLAIPAVSKVNISGPGPLGIIISKDVELFLTIYSVAKVSISKLAAATFFEIQLLLVKNARIENSRCIYSQYSSVFRAASFEGVRNQEALGDQGASKT